MARATRSTSNQAEKDAINFADHPGYALEIIGQDSPQQAFLERWNAGRTHHAILLQGPQGIGKASFAFMLARFILYEGGTPQPSLFGGGGADEELTKPIQFTSLIIPEENPLHHQLVEGAHNDFRYIYPAEDKSQIAIAQIRELIRFTKLTAGSGGWRVIIIDAVDDLTHAAANALLKILEEPPTKTIFLLVSHRPGSLLPTIRSRCSKLNFNNLDDAIILKLLSEKEPTLDHDQIRAIIALANGSIGLALKLVRLGGIDLYQSMLNVLALPNQDNFKARAELANSVSGKAGKQRFLLLGDLLNSWMARLILAEGGAKPFPPTSELEAKAIAEQSKGKNLYALLDRARTLQELSQQSGTPSNLDTAQLIHVMFA